MLPRYTPASPDIFSVGDIVELQVSFRAVPVFGRPRQFRMGIILRSLALIDDSFTKVGDPSSKIVQLLNTSQEASMALARFQLEGPRVIKTLKRRLDFSGNESESDGEACLTRMRI